jgi:transposase InsO family protein
MQFTKEEQIRRRLNWFIEAREVGNVTRACKNCGIARKTYYKWWSIYQNSGSDKESLADRSRRPKSHPKTIEGAWKRRIVKLRKKTGYGPDRIWAIFTRKGLNNVPSPTGIYQVLKREGLIRKKRKPSRKKHKRRYEMPNPGDRIQIDIKYVPYLMNGQQHYQYTAIDDCSRYRIVSFYEERSNFNSKDFLLHVINNMPFPVKSIQTDNDTTFTNWYTGAQKTAPDKKPKIHTFTRTCHQYDIEHILIKPATPQLNGKVERSHETDEEEFYRISKAQSLNELRRRFNRWLLFYNYQRLHSSLAYKTPAERIADKIGWHNMGKCFEDIQNLITKKPKRGAGQGRAKRVPFTLDKKTERRLSFLPNLHVTHV